MLEYRKCRLCMGYKSNQIPIFKRDVSMKIMKLADVQIREDDGLPTTICIDCETELGHCYDFIGKIQWADKKFREDMKTTEIEVNECNIKEELGIYEGLKSESSFIDNSFYEMADVQKTFYTTGVNEKTETECLNNPINHIEIEDNIRGCSDQMEVSSDPLGQEEPLIDAQMTFDSEPAMDPLTCMKEEAVQMDNTDNKAENTTSSSMTCMKEEAVQMDNTVNKAENTTSSSTVLKCHPLKKRLTHNDGSNKYDETSVSKATKINTRYKEVSKRVRNKRRSSLVSLKMVSIKSIKNQFPGKTNKDCGKRHRIKGFTPVQTQYTTNNENCIEKSTCCIEENKNHFERKTEEITSSISDLNITNSNSTLINSEEINCLLLATPAECHGCSATFKNNADLQKHLSECSSFVKFSSKIVVHKSDNHKCNICHKKFHSFNSWQRHNKSVHIVTVDFECNFCMSIFQTEKLLLKHINSCQNNIKLMKKADFLCQVCGLVVKSRESLHRHNKRFHVNMPAKIMCEICGKIFKFTSHLTSHKNFMHPSEKDKVICHICDKEFLCQVRLKRHLRITHCITRRYVCDICKKAFKDKKTLDVHLTVHSIDEPFKCEICDKAFKTKYKLHTHLTSHADEQFKCTTCYRMFLSEGNLKLHIEKSHKNVLKIFYCDVCNKETYTLSQFKLHMKLHDNPEMQLFTCDLCGKCFESKIKCDRHRLYHNIDNKELRCLICEKTFKSNKILKHHLFLHSNDSFLYKCEICNKKFKHSGAFYSHKRVHNKTAYFECGQCNEKFRWKQTYDKHVLKCHQTVFY